MKRTVKLLTVLLLCLGMIFPVFASASVFVPSVSRPEKPVINQIVLVTENAQNSDQTQSETVGTCVIVSTVIEAREATTDITQGERDLLVELHEQIEAGVMQLPMPRSNVILQLVDVSWRVTECISTEHTHEEAMEHEETFVMADFELGVAADEEVLVMVYVDEQWQVMEEVTNNGDGSITVKLYQMGPVAFSVAGKEEAPVATVAPTVPTFAPELEEVPEYPLYWVILLVTAFVLLLILVFLRIKQGRDRS